MNKLASSQYVILKADDLGFIRNKFKLVAAIKKIIKSFPHIPNDISQEEKRWKKFTNFVLKRNIKASLGLVGNYLEIGGPAFIGYARFLCKNGAFEIWNHGYDHQRRGTEKNGEVICEFKHTDYDFQLSHLLRTQSLAKNKLGIILRTFGAPENAIDNTTIEALSAVKDIDVWYFCLPQSNKFPIHRVAEIERPLFRPNYNEFSSRYDENLPMMALQIHPAQWSDHDFDEFVRIIDFLIERNVVFISPHEYFILSSR